MKYLKSLMLACFVLAMVSCDNEDMETAEMEEVVAIPEVLPTPEHLLGLKAELEAKGLELV
uniref:hypothetical protein n=1 Tax=Ancylomarina sp. TaxID=1970196 RepID=UPI00356352C4